MFAVSFFAARSAALAHGRVVPGFNPAAWMSSGANTCLSYKSENLSFDYPDAYRLKENDQTGQILLANADSSVVVTYLRDDIVIPIEPFFGTMGVCPADASKQAVMPPGIFGGNMDIRQLTRGSTLYLPVQVEGALFSCGDAHAAQGDGEVCVTGIEAPMYATLRFTLEKGRAIPAPQFLTPGPLTPRVDTAGFYGTTSVGPDLYKASQDAVRAMIDHLVATYRL